MDFSSYTKDFHKITMKSKLVEPECVKLARYMQELRMNIQDELSLCSPITVQKCFQFALKVEEKIKIQRFLSGLPYVHRSQIQYDEPKTLEEAIRKARHMYEQGKVKEDLAKPWKGKKHDIKFHGKKGFKPTSFEGNSFQPKPKISH